MKNDIYKVLIVFALLLSASAFLVSEACAQDEHDGFFKRMMKRLQGEDPATTSREERVESPKHAMPSVPPAPKAVPVPERSIRVKSEEATVETPAPKISEESELTREEMVSEINEMLADNENLINFAPQMKKNVDANGNIYYTYNIEEESLILEDLSTLDLDSLYMRLMTESSRLNAQRILEQLDQIRRTQRIITGPPATPMAPRIPSAPPTIPNIPSTPRIPRTPTAPPQAPSAPATPPAPPVRR